MGIAIPHCGEKSAQMVEGKEFKGQLSRLGGRR